MCQWTVNVVNCQNVCRRRCKQTLFTLLLVSNATPIENIAIQFTHKNTPNATHVHGMEPLSTLRLFVRRTCDGFPSQRTNNVELCFISLKKLLMGLFRYFHQSAGMSPAIFLSHSGIYKNTLGIGNTTYYWYCGYWDCTASIHAITIVCPRDRWILIRISRVAVTLYSCNIYVTDVPVKPVFNDHLMGYFSAFWCSSRWPRAT